MVGTESLLLIFQLYSKNGEYTQQQEKSKNEENTAVVITI